MHDPSDHEVLRKYRTSYGYKVIYKGEGSILKIEEKFRYGESFEIRFFYDEKREENIRSYLNEHFNKMGEGWRYPYPDFEMIYLDGVGATVELIFN